MNRPDICPSCKKQLRWSPADDWGFQPGQYYCTRCGYKRWEGSSRNLWKTITKKVNINKNE